MMTIRELAYLKGDSEVFNHAADMILSKLEEMNVKKDLLKIDLSDTYATYKRNSAMPLSIREGKLLRYLKEVSASESMENSISSAIRNVFSHTVTIYNKYTDKELVTLYVSGLDSDEVYKDLFKQF